MDTTRTGLQVDRLLSSTALEVDQQEQHLSSQLSSQLSSTTLSKSNTDASLDRQDGADSPARTRECVVCMGAPRATRFSPCGHSQCCARCARELLLRRGETRCPTCRQPIHKVTKSAAIARGATPGSTSRGGRLCISQNWQNYLANCCTSNSKKILHVCRYWPDYHVGQILGGSFSAAAKPISATK